MLSKTAKTLASFGRTIAAAQLKKMPWTKRRIDGAKRRVLKPFIPLRERLEENSRQAARKELISEFNNKAAGPGQPELQARTVKALPANQKKKTSPKKAPVTDHRKGGAAMNKKTVKPQFNNAAKGVKKSAPPPRLTMADGPKPPGSVANAVKGQVRQSQNQSNALKNAKAPTLKQPQTRQQQFNANAQKQSVTQKFNQASAQKMQGMQKSGIKR